MVDNKKQTVFDYENQEEISMDSAYVRRLIQGIVEIQGRIPKMGYFTPNRAKNIVVEVKGGTYVALSKDIFIDKFLVYNNNTGKYGYHIGKDDLNYIKTFSLHKGSGDFPYSSITRDYNAQRNLEKFASTAKACHVNPSKYKSLVPYTFGLEYETSAGYVPEELCYSKGLIPLRDGSITGVEYASIVMNSQTGFELLREQLDVLKTYTEYDKECSLHIHFGGYPVDEKAITVLYFIFERLQYALHHNEIVPHYTFSTCKYKSSGKDYCKMLPGRDTFNSIYEFLSGGGTPFLGSFTIPHPGDQRHDTKWNIHSRYYAMNLINMCFYQTPKTVEMRFLRPSYNYNKIVNWIFIFSSILQFANKYAIESTKGLKYNTIYNKICNLFDGSISDFERIFTEVYPSEIVSELMNFLTTLSAINHKQIQLGDYIGKLDKFDDSLITTNALEV